MGGLSARASSLTEIVGVANAAAEVAARATIEISLQSMFEGGGSDVQRNVGVKRVVG